MPNDDALLPDSLALMPREFGLEAQASVDLDAVRRLLAGRIADLLDRNPALLMSILYRIDVAEANVQQAITHSAPDRLALDLAELVLERQLQKARLRRQYGSGPETPPT